MESSRYNFIKAEWPNLHEIIADIEKNLINHSNISMMKLRQLIEQTIKYIFQYENTQLPKEKLDLKTSIELILKQNIMPIKSVNVLNTARKIGNKAVHDNYSDPLQATELYEKVFYLLAWFVSRYGSIHYKFYLEGLDIYDKVIFQEYLLDAKLDSPPLCFIRSTETVGSSDAAPHSKENSISLENTKKAAEKGSSDALFELGCIYLKHYEDIQDIELLKDAIDYFKIAAKKKIFQLF